MGSLLGIIDNEGFVDGRSLGGKVGCVDKLGRDVVEGEAEGVGIHSYGSLLSG